MLKNQHGGDIYSRSYRLDYSANINPLGTPESVIKAAQNAVLRSEHYPDVHYRELAAAISRKENIESDCIICGNGAADLIFSIVHAKKPEKALLVSPGFAEYEQALMAVGCQIEYYDLCAEHQFCIGDDYCERLTEDLDMIFLCCPNNPTGILPEHRLILKILQHCRESKILAVCDFCFLDFLEEKEAYDLVSVCRDYSNLFILKAFTKIYAMAGLRLGYGITSDKALLQRMREVMQPWGVSLPAQEAGVVALREEGFVLETRKMITLERSWMYEQMKPLMEELYEGKANFLFFRTREDFGKRCEEEGILIRDCSNYRGLTKGYYRVAVRTHEENEELIKVMKKILCD